MPTTISRCELLHHGAAANSSHKVIACIPSADGNIRQGDDENIDTNIALGSSELVYASHLMLNVAKPKIVSISNSAVDESTGVGTQEKIWNVEQTLRTSTSLTEAEAETAAANVSTRTAKRVITCVVQLGWVSQMRSNDENDRDVVLVCGFSDGTLTSWYRPRHRKDWEEHVLLKSTQDRKDSMSSSEISLEEDAVTAMKGRSITDIDGYVTVNNDDNDDDKQKRRLDLSVVACSSGGAQYFQFTLILNNYRDSEKNNGCTQRPLQESNHCTTKDMKRLIRTPSNSIKFHAIATGSSGNDIENVFGIFLVGTAAPRHNKIHVFEIPSSYMQRSTQTAESQIAKNEFAGAPKYSGSLTGHEDWITCFDWSTIFFSTPIDVAQNKGTVVCPTDSCCYLASGSQDAKIRLWKWVTTETKVTAKTTSSKEISDIISDSGDDDEEEDDEEVIEGEARLEIHHASNTSNYQMTTSVYLEALLIGHEEMVTSVAWHPNPKKVFNRDLVLFSSSMDRSIFLWCTSTDGNNANDGSDGVWTPIARVGSPSGILGGPVGSSLLGYLHVQIEPEHGRWIMGHAYGGALHFFSAEQYIEDGRMTDVGSGHTDMTIKKQADVKWKAQPCITGHFDEVTDLCWEALEGEYLITVSNDATCRIWAPIAPSLETWIEISRPQVHGYSLSAVTSLSTSDHKHHLVTGADEKELRVFDGTKSFLRVLRLVGGGQGDRNAIAANDDIARVDRAYMPSLGLSNKNTASEGADEDTGEASTSSTSLPIERDLGSTSLWPETRKMYGHNSEIARLSSTLSARTCLSLQFVSPHINQILVASSTKARDVNTATIRLWDVDENRCLQTLQGGHRSTVTAMSFSPDGTYLASSGKDRRLCIWKRQTLENSSGQNDLFFLASAVNSSHKRIVWSVHFCPYNPTILASGSRDGTVKLWKIFEGSVEGNQDTSVKEFLKFVPTLYGDTSGMSKGKAEAVTSLAFSPSRSFGTSRGILAIGLENGLIQLWSVPITPCSDDNSVEPASLAQAFDPQLCHIGAIKKLAWRPMRDDNDGPLVLASCASDNGCRIFSVWLGNE
jgi:elongator complex protein 2